jgi:hypothetical protein
LITRKQWGAKPLTAYNQLISKEQRTGIIVHHSVTSRGTTLNSVAGILRNIDDYHRRKGWGGIGYNFAVDHKGRIYEARGRDILGVHAAGSNTANFGICYIGNNNPTKKAVKAIQVLVAELQEYTNKKLLVQGHAKVNLTACPGSKLLGEIAKGTFDLPYSKKEYTMVLPGETNYRKLASRLLGKPNTLNARIKEARRLKDLNNKEPLFTGKKVRIK